MPVRAHASVEDLFGLDQHGQLMMFYHIELGVQQQTVRGAGGATSLQVLGFDPRNTLEARACARMSS